MSRTTALLLGAALLAASSVARAQSIETGASAEAASGVEGGARGLASGIRRARTQLRLGADVRVDESPNEIVSGGVLLELEPRTSLGADLRYVRRASPEVWLFGGVAGYVVPQTLAGVTFGGSYRYHMAKTVDFTVGPTINVFFLGSDLPTSAVIWQGLLQVGIHADL